MELDGLSQTGYSGQVGFDRVRGNGGTVDPLWYTVYSIFNVLS